MHIMMMNASEEDREELITSTPESWRWNDHQCRVSIESTKTTLGAVTERYKFCLCGSRSASKWMMNISGLNEETFAWLKEQTKRGKVVAVGEIGLLIITGIRSRNTKTKKDTIGLLSR